MATEREFNNRIALVTGGGGGIGRAICQVLAEAGARVSVCDINLHNAEETVNTLPSPESHVAIHMDVADKASVEEGLAATQARLKGVPTLLVNNAGIMRTANFLDMTEHQFTSVMDVNLKGTFLVSQAVCKAIIENGMTKGSAIVNIGSILGRVSFPTHSQYCASKAAVISFSKTCAKELASTGIRVNCVMPGPINTPLMDIHPQEVLDQTIVDTPIGRLGEPREVAKLVSFLLSEKSSYMVGACVEITGGHSL